MIGIVIVAHSLLAQEFSNALNHVMGGPQEAVIALSFSGDGSMEDDNQYLVDAIKEVNQGHGVVILTDMFGGSPSNLALSHLVPGEIEVIAGVNLPLLIRLASIRHSKPISECIQLAQEAGKNYIHVASNILGHKALST